MPFLLPDKYNFAHNFSFYLHDLLVQTIIEGERDQKFGARFLIPVEMVDEYSKTNGEATFDWLLEVGKRDIFDELSYKQVFVAILADFNQFIFNALRASEKGHLSVAYALLRKPFKDNLLILENLVSDAEKFLDVFNFGQVHLDLAIDRMSKEQKIEAISAAMRRLGYEYISPEDMYDFRYAKASVTGLEPLWQQAMHIVTSSPHYRTEQGNLNFIFSDENALESQWYRFYALVPMLLAYACLIGRGIFYGPIEGTCDLEQKKRIDQKILLGQVIALRSLVTSKEITSSNGDIAISCQHCDELVVFNEKCEIKILEEQIYHCSKGHKNDYFEMPSTLQNDE